MASKYAAATGQSQGKRVKTRSKGNLNRRVRIFALLWFFLVAVTSIFLLYMLRTVLNYQSVDKIQDASNEIKIMENYVGDMLQRNNQYLRNNNGDKSLAEKKHNPLSSKIRPDDAITVAFAVSVTGCGSDPLTEGAAVLKHSIHRASIQGDLGGKYNYKMYAIYHPGAQSCAQTLEALGYELLERDTFIKVSDIEGDFLRNNIEKNGCCGEKEFIKLEAYTLVQHKIVVHLDLDVLVLKPLDDIFDVMMQSEHEAEGEPLDLTQIDIMWPPSGGQPTPPTKVNAFFTRDYNMVSVKKKYKPVQGGFLVLRPDMNVYNEFKSIALKGDFREKGGWGGLVGPFYGAMTFQGIMPYYYDVLHPGEALELNRCVVNQMCDNPRDGKTIDDIVHGNCRTGEEDCEDCRNRPLEDIITTHYTLCQKPWLCIPHDQDTIQHRLCRKLHREWFQIRSEMEVNWGRSGMGQGAWQKEQFFGYCTKMGNKGYVPIQTPYGIA